LEEKAAKVRIHIFQGSLPWVSTSTQERRARLGVPTQRPVSSITDTPPSEDDQSTSKLAPPLQFTFAYIYQSHHNLLMFPKTNSKSLETSKLLKTVCEVEAADGVGGAVVVPRMQEVVARVCLLPIPKHRPNARKPKYNVNGVMKPLQRVIWLLSTLV